MAAVELWRGEFGNAYTDRNQVDWRARRPFWRDVMSVTGARSVLEIGCNAGWNLSAIKWDFPQVRAVGTDVNPHALEQAHTAGLEVYECLDFRAVPGKFDLVFTAGVLIHIEPRHVNEVMAAIIDKSAKWVLAVEYESNYETEIEYRGQSGLCWKRPYGVMYESMGLKYSEQWAPSGFDNCTAWLMSK